MMIRVAGLWALVLIVLLLPSGCSDPEPTSQKFAQVIGSKGHTAGKFNRPRGIRYDPAGELLYIVDWDGRIQKFTLAGEFRGSWIMPEVEKGKPEDLWITPEGNVLVTDTHYSRILEFTPKGKEVQRFGSYGGGDGQFIYPVGICMDKEGNIYVSEYGDNNRVQKFSRKGKFLKSFGGFGYERGQFQRPSGIGIGPDNNLYVTDAVNHRIQVFSLEGKLLRVIGKQGTQLGDLTYPYDLDFRGNTLYVLEYGNNRIQTMTLAGKGIATWGSTGKGDGQFSSPWRFAVIGNDMVYVSDTNNSRVVKVLF